MARGKSTKLLATLPDSYGADWLTKLDKRTKIARAVLARIGELESDAGGAESLSAARRSLIRHAAWLDAIVESYEMKLAGGEQIDVGGHTQALNSLLGLFRLLGLERKAKRGPTLREVMDAPVSASEPLEAPHSDETDPDSPIESTGAPDPLDAAAEAV
jgi:hypothetical protein